MHCDKCSENLDNTDPSDIIVYQLNIYCQFCWHEMKQMAALMAIARAQGGAGWKELTK